MRRLISPDSNWRSFSDITSICLPILKSETSVGAICLTKVRKSSLDSCMTLMSNKLFSNKRVFASWLVSIDSIVSMILYPYSILLYVIIFIYKRKTKKNKYTKYLVLLFIYIIYNYTDSPLKCQVFFLLFLIWWQMLLFLLHIWHTLYIYTTHAGFLGWGVVYRDYKVWWTLKGYLSLHKI